MSLPSRKISAVRPFSPRSAGCSWAENSERGPTIVEQPGLVHRDGTRHNAVDPCEHLGPQETVHAVDHEAPDHALVDRDALDDGLSHSDKGHRLVMGGDSERIGDLLATSFGDETDLGRQVDRRQVGDGVFNDVARLELPFDPARSNPDAGDVSAHILGERDGIRAHEPHRLVRRPDDLDVLTDRCIHRIFLLSNQCPAPADAAGVASRSESPDGQRRNVEFGIDVQIAAGAKVERKRQMQLGEPRGQMKMGRSQHCSVSHAGTGAADIVVGVQPDIAILPDWRRGQA